MGDLGTLKSRETYDNDSIDRLRYRLEKYRNQHNTITNNRDPAHANSLNDQCREETLGLRQRWLESKARKQNKPRTAGVLYGNKLCQSKTLTSDNHTDNHKVGT